MFQKGGSSRSNRLRLLPFDKVEHALRRALLRYAQIAQLATHARYLHALQCTRGFVSPQTTGFGFSKRWVSFHKTTRIIFRCCPVKFCLSQPNFCRTAKQNPPTKSAGFAL